MPPYNSTQITLALPGFHGLVKRLVLANVIVYFAMLVLGLVAPGLAVGAMGLFALQPAAVVHNFALWQLVSYGFLHAGVLHIFFNMLMLWFVGARLEDDFGSQWFGENYFFSLIGGGIISVAASFLPLLRVSPYTITIGASGAILGLLAAYAVFYGESEMYLFFVLRMKVKYLVAILILLDLAGLISSSGNVAFAAHLGGAFSGYLYAKLAPRRGFGLNLSESWYGVRNAWYRRKRQKAARKFEVYISKQSKSAPVIDHDSKRDPNDRRWMN